MRQHLEDILLEVSCSSLIDAGDMHAVANLIISSILKGLRVKRAGIWLLDDDHQHIRCHMLVDEVYHHQANDLVLSKKDFPAYFSALELNRSIVANKAKTNSATSEFAEGYLASLNILSMLDCPIRHRGEMIGILCVESIGEQRDWQEDEQHFGASIAELYGRAISANQRNMYEEQLKRSNQQLERDVDKRTQRLQDSLDELKSMQDSLIESEKLAALGRLVAGISHEVNTPIGVAVTGNSHCQHIRQNLADDFEQNRLSKSKMQKYLDELDESINLVEANLNRAASLIHNFKQTAVDQNVIELTDLDLSAYISVVLSSLNPILKPYKVQLHYQPGDVVNMHSYPGAFAQILTNLVNNACTHAFEKGENNQINIGLATKGKDVILTFKDNGKGMDEETQKHLFEPFYTTNREGGGSGLGMSIIFNLVRNRLQGTIEVNSEIGQGTEVILTLPRDVKPDKV
ncbi:GAF domain-containing sensor histidine kinase [Neptunicella marina]|uniref:histidine kinase n=1 Tax=Neptunicella marina TaxID=2125989 RepID=A0A8J6J1E5_9ALTE|nr:GAF domain-containing sensor histidine kinase [Neptunicella marina]MBC3767808.1 GAF domain-containing sensor histidine kinase [Neptunicella marina]